MLRRSGTPMHHGGNSIGTCYLSTRRHSLAGTPMRHQGSTLDTHINNVPRFPGDGPRCREALQSVTRSSCSKIRSGHATSRQGGVPLQEHPCVIKATHLTHTTTCAKISGGRPPLLRNISIGDPIVMPRFSPRQGGIPWEHQCVIGVATTLPCQAWMKAHVARPKSAPIIAHTGISLPTGAFRSFLHCLLMGHASTT
jgi:hypothetical protein